MKIYVNFLLMYTRSVTHESDVVRPVCRTWFDVIGVIRGTGCKTFVPKVCSGSRVTFSLVPVGHRFGYTRIPLTHYSSYIVFPEDGSSDGKRNVGNRRTTYQKSLLIWWFGVFGKSLSTSLWIVINSVRNTRVVGTTYKNTCSFICLWGTEDFKQWLIPVFRFTSSLCTFMSLS